MNERNNWTEVLAKLKGKNSEEAMEYYEISWDVLVRHIDKIQQYKRLASYQKKGSARVNTSYVKAMNAFEIMLLLEEGDHGDEDGFGVEPDTWGIAYLDTNGEFISDFICSINREERQKIYRELCIKRREDYFAGALLGASVPYKDDDILYLVTTMAMAYADNIDIAYKKGMQLGQEIGYPLLDGISTLGAFSALMAGLLSGLRLYDVREYIWYQIIRPSEQYRNLMLQAFPSTEDKRNNNDEKSLTKLREIPGETGSFIAAQYAFFLYKKDYPKAMNFIEKYRGKQDIAVKMGGCILGAMLGAKEMPMVYTEDNNLYPAVIGKAEEIHKSLLKRILEG